MKRILYLHLHRYLTRTLKSDNDINDQSKKLLNILYAEMDSLTIGAENYHSLALYRCLILIDNCISGLILDIYAIIKILEKCSSFFPDSYVFGMLQIVVSLHFGKTKSSIFLLIS
jgi:hypothetical protein